MSPREGMYYVGLMGGIVGGVAFARQMGWPQIAGLLCGAIVGFPLGFLSERLYVLLTRKPKSESDSFASQVTVHRTCGNPTCQWTGDPGYSSICPRCGQELTRAR